MQPTPATSRLVAWARKVCFTQVNKGRPRPSVGVNLSGRVSDLSMAVSTRAGDSGSRNPGFRVLIAGKLVVSVGIDGVCVARRYMDGLVS